VEARARDAHVGPERKGVCSQRPLTLDGLARRIGAELRGDGSRRVRAVRPLEDAGAEDVAFYANPRYRKELQATRACAVILAEDEAAHAPASASKLVAPQPYVCFAKASALFNPEDRPLAGIHPGASVGPGAEIAPPPSS